MELKFRVWNKNHKSFMYWGFIDGSFIGPPSGRGMSIEECEKLSEQFTGMHDINGKEIYLSDIINITNCECTGYDDQGNEIYVDCIGEVLFEDGTFVFDGHSAGTIPLSAFIAEMNVIGNIHENPELLNL